ncbi:hypothetical protein ABH930_004795 [Kitasatospora sp. GAS204A]|uniref:hypothetical protein n=1 Tax=unclassified Kitasatospora TaxID=2633591 RepID=UPI00247431DE|nr:hypothetical protein [Kitasatospora sp. GAS204B]MDH6120699.1 hypothetical protein [Kitasatospora sp. GAS204B]
MSSRSRRSAALLLALPLLLAGCASAVADSNHASSVHASEAPTSTEAPPSLPATPVLDSANDKPLPLDGYLLNPAQLLTVEKAQARLISDCMTRFGFSYTPPAPVLPGRDSDAPATRIDGRYGRQSTALLATWGYHPEGGGQPATKPPAEPPMSTQMATAERGTSDPKQRFGSGGQTVNGQQVPDRGCIGEAGKQLTGSAEGLVGDPQFASDLNLSTLQSARDDARTQAVFARWSQCMKTAGFSYADPLAAMGDPAWATTAAPTPHELQVATADGACRHQENVVGVWYTVDYAYQQRAIDENAAAMAKVRTALATEVQAATAALGS